MSKKVMDMGAPPYDTSNPRSIIEYAAKLTGHTLKNIFGDESNIIGGVNTKGRFGQIVESDYFYIDNNNLPEPDFREAKIELKVAPMKKKGNTLKSKERIILGILNYDDVPKKGFSIFMDKCSHILMIFYLWEKDADIFDYKFLKVINWEPTENELRLIHEDWDIIESYVIRGEAHLLSEKNTKFLAAATKGVGHGKDERNQPFSSKLAKQRALSFKSPFVTSIFNSRRDVNELTIDPIPDDESETIFTGEWKEGIHFEEYVLSRFERFKDRTCREIEGILNIDISDSSKQYYYLLTLAMMNIRHKKHVKEFDQAGISIKTIRLKANGRPKESMSFPAFKYEEVAQQDWEDSDFYSQIDHEFFFPVFQFRTNETSKTPRKDLAFKGAFFWSLPDKDFDIVKQVWMDTQSKIRREDFDDFVKSSDKRISHVRPHGKNSQDTYPYKGRDHVKKSFWFNDTYIINVVDENLKHH